MVLDHPEPDNCVGPQSDQAGKASACEGCPNQKACLSGAGKEEDPTVALVAAKLASVRRKLLVLSGKGGVGKSTVAAQLAFGLAAKGLRVGLLDVDICGPSVPLMLGVQGATVHSSAAGWSPVWVCVNGDDAPAEEDVEIGVMSIGFMLPAKDDAVIWRGPRKNGLIRQFLTDVDWGDLDVLLVDTPPGTSDEHISTVQYLKDALGPHDGAVVVTTPQEAAMADVRKELNFCAKTKLRVVGVVENMATMRQPLADVALVTGDGSDISARLRAALAKADPSLLEEAFVETNVFPIGPSSAAGPAGPVGPEAMAAAFGVPYIGRLPLDPAVGRAGDAGRAVHGLGKGSAAAAALEALCARVETSLFPDGDAVGPAPVAEAGEA